ncbi:Serine/threonine protein kinase [Handroanthus impetiginosus]|uniref:Serine/threonine protein kinase n=1 Tax=Handroanthus impetiginosus TaxID=429701 RepID=A0A2G9G7M0_9LAMI|nr:Serine/threonine protein kinase [Handroanthus impetiginosus]
MEKSFRFFTFTPLLLLHFLMLHTLANTPTNIVTDQSSLTGVTCGSSHLRITTLNISNMNLAGTIPPHIGNLTFLVYLNMSKNLLHGNIPEEISHLHRLNLLRGNISEEISHLHRLRIDLTWKNFTGEVPRSWFSSLHLLEVLFLYENKLNGVIPDEIRNLHKLKDLRLQNNRSNGPVPAVIFNMSLLEFVSLRNNCLSGRLPSDIRSHNVMRLRGLVLSRNMFYGEIPSNLSQCEQLETLSLANNNFSGILPRDIVNMTTLWSEINNCLSDKEDILLGHQHGFEFRPKHSSPYFLHRPIPQEISNLRNLEYLGMEYNNLSRVRPSVILNISFVQYLSCAHNNLSSSMPSEIGNPTMLRTIYLKVYLGNNNLKGQILDSVANSSKLTTLELGFNQFSGLIPYNNPLDGTFPPAIGNFSTSLRYIIADNCKINGSVPSEIGNLSALLSSNKLNSNMPDGIWSYGDLLRLDLSSNSLSGSLSPNIRNLHAAVVIDLLGNLFLSNIPRSIGDLESLTGISLANNRFRGSIPETMSNMLSFESLDIYNNRSRVIPKSLETLKYLAYFNVSFNDLSGEICSNGPFRNFTNQSFIMNKNLCGDPRFNVLPCHIKSSKRLKLLIVLVSLGAAIVMIANVVVLVLMKFQKENQIQNLLLVLQLVVLGTGAYGTIYKGFLRVGTTVAVKVFNLQVGGALESFDAQCEALRSLRHGNLTKVICSCSNNSFKALVLEYMSKGSPYSHYYFLDIRQRLDIMIDVVSALEYLHHGYSMLVIHCDLKPINVLMDEDTVAHVSDLGMAKLLAGKDSITHTRTLATLCYMAPFPAKCDVYSYEIMLMEKCLQDSLPNEIQEIMDANLMDPNQQQYTEKLNCLRCIMELAISCTTDVPKEGISMNNVLSTLKKIKIELVHLVGM